MSINWNDPAEVKKAYDEGLKGATFDPIDMMRLLEELPNPFFSGAGNELFGTGKGVLSLPYKAVQHFFPLFGEDENQKQGDCVAKGTRNAIDVTRAYEILYKGEKELFLARGACEGIYGSRGHGSEGMHCSQAARFVSVAGGVLVRRKYPEAGVDLSTYDPKLSGGWGRSGVPKSVIDTAQKNRISASSVGSIEQARDLLANGYGLSVCSNYGFNSIRDKYGIAEPKGSWAHCMCVCGVDDTHERLPETLFLVVNSWGRWNSGPKVHDQPEGSFWVRQKVAEGMIGYGATFAFSDFQGFRRRMDWSRIKEIYK